MNIVTYLIGKTTNSPTIEGKCNAFRTPIEYDMRVHLLDRHKKELLLLFHNESEECTKGITSRENFLTGL
ncbi:MAG: hypothetical protein WAM14_26660 [Candidatus Nitrosopolaris sp.]